MFVGQMQRKKIVCSLNGIPLRKMPSSPLLLKGGIELTSNDKNTEFKNVIYLRINRRRKNKNLVTKCIKMTSVK